MKKLLLSALSLFALAISTTSYAQASAESTLEKSLAAVSLPTAVRPNDIKPGTRIAKDAISDKIQNSFNRSFSNGKNDQWFLINKKVFGVNFDNNGRYSRAAFTKNGAMLYCVMQGSEQHLPKEDRKAIKSNYVDYNITHVAEVTSQGRTVWIANLQDEHNLVVVRVADGTLDEIANYKLSKTKK